MLNVWKDWGKIISKTQYINTNRSMPTFIGSVFKHLTLQYEFCRKEGFKFIQNLAVKNDRLFISSLSTIMMYCKNLVFLECKH